MTDLNVKSPGARKAGRLRGKRRRRHRRAGARSLEGPGPKPPPPASKRKARRTPYALTRRPMSKPPS